MSKAKAPKFPTVPVISYTPQTLAAAIALNIRRERSARDKANVSWDQQWWATIDKTTDVQLVAIDQYDDGIPETWAAIDCATACCTAGWATSLSGDLFVVPQWRYDQFAIEVKDDPEAEVHVERVFIKETKKTMEVQERAKELLGIEDGEEMHFLFSPNRKMSEVLNILDTISSGGWVEDSDAWSHSYRTADRVHNTKICRVCIANRDEENGKQMRQSADLDVAVSQDRVND